jgi:hypothetical protein
VGWMVWGSILGSIKEFISLKKHPTQFCSPLRVFHLFKQFLFTDMLKKLYAGFTVYLDHDIAILFQCIDMSALLLIGHKDLN